MLGSEPLAVFTDGGDALGVTAAAVGVRVGHRCHGGWVDLDGDGEALSEILVGRIANPHAVLELPARPVGRGAVSTDRCARVDESSGQLGDREFFDDVTIDVADGQIRGAGRGEADRHDRVVDVRSVADALGREGRDVQASFAGARRLGWIAVGNSRRAPIPLPEP